MHEIGFIDEDNEGRRTGADLGGIVDAEPPAVVHGGIVHSNSLVHNVVELTGRNADAVLLISKACHLHDLLHALTRFCGNEQHRDIAHESEVRKHFLFEFFDRVGILFNRISFIDDQYACLALLMDIAGNAHILLA